jgi:carboxypeptidase C (cathepsin A)
MENILVHNENNDTKSYEYQGNFDIHKLREAIQIFIREFDKNEKVIITTSSNKKTNRKITWKEAKEFYDDYPFQKLTDENDSSYHQLKLTFVQYEILTQFTVKTEDELYGDILDKL